MTEVTASQTLLSFSKVNASILKRLDNIDKKLESTTKAEPEQVLEKPKPVEIEGLSPEAAKQLAKVLNQQQSELKDLKNSRVKEKIGKSIGSNLLSDLARDALETILKLLATGALIGILAAIVGDIVKRLFKGEFAAKKAFTASVAKILSPVANLVERTIDKITKATEKFISKIESQTSARAAKAAEEAAAKRLAEAEAKAAKAAVAPGSEKALTEFYLKQSAQKGAAATAGAAPKPSEFGKYASAEQLERSKALGSNYRKVEGIQRGAGASSLKYETGGGGELFGWAKKGMSWAGEKYAAGKEMLAGAAEKSLTFLKPLQKVAQSSLLKGTLKVLGFPGVIDTLFAGYQVKEAIENFKKTKDKRQLINDISDAAGGAMGSTLGMLSGGAAGAFGGPLGTFIGGLIGSFGGDYAGRWIVSNLKDDSKESLANNILKYTGFAIPGVNDEFKAEYESIKAPPTPKLSTVEGVQPPITGEDASATISPTSAEGKTQLPQGGQKLETFFSSNLQMGKEGNDLFRRYADYSSDNLSKQLKLLTENNNFLSQISEKLAAPANFVSNPTFITSSGGMSTLRSLQGVGN